MHQQRILIFIILIFLNSIVAFSQSISGELSLLPNQEIKLEGFNGLNTYLISSGKMDEEGNFSLPYSQSDIGVGYLISADNKPLFVILSGEDIELTGTSLSSIESLKITRGKENQWFEQYAQEHPRRAQALNAWTYLEKIYLQDSLFSKQEIPKQAIINEKRRIRTADSMFVTSLPNQSYVRWYLPVRKLVSSVSVIAQYRPEEMAGAIEAFRNMDYTDSRLYKSGLLKDAIDSHFWLLENSGKALDSVNVEMMLSIDVMMVSLVKDEKILNEVTAYLFSLLEKHSLFKASEYLALKALNEVSCTIDDNLARQLESYRAMKKGNTAPDISFGTLSYLNGVKQNQYSHLSSLNTPYTLIVFGASWCPKCMAELPKVAERYGDWRNVGVEVVYISLDTDRTALEQALSSYPFLVYCDFNKWDSKVAEDYFVFGTPTYFLLDSSRKILLRPISVDHVDAWIAQLVSKAGK